MKQSYLVVFSLLFCGTILFLFHNIKQTSKNNSDAELKELVKKTEYLIKQQLELKETIKTYETKIDSLDRNIGKIKNEKIIIKEFYHEKIKSIDTLSNTQLDSFFTDRYR
jgi:septal ring factor EnvC (AmiA/AmiB activator)